MKIQNSWSGSGLYGRPQSRRTEAAPSNMGHILGNLPCFVMLAFSNTCIIQKSEDISVFCWNRKEISAE
jgi:hypothetical protein